MNTSALTFDLEAYAARYHGRGRIQRMRFIAERNAELRIDALRIAVVEAKKGVDTLLYKEILQQAQGAQGEEFEIDNGWILYNDRWAAKELEKLRHELEDNKQQANKEVIRTGHNDLGDFFHKRGKLQQARGDYTKTRDYCMHPQHSLQMCLKVILVSIEARDFAHVENHFIMAENIPDVDKGGEEICKMRACAGLALLVRGNFSAAAMRFLYTCLDANEDKVAKLQKVFGDVMALEDVATYGGLCALASLDRKELTNQVVQNEPFRALLELVPDVREMVFDFYHSRYTRCLATMEKLKAELMLDMHLGREDHVDRLFRLIRRKAIVQYVSPFVSADLRKMAKVFKTGGAELEEELLALIECGDIDARIDSQNNALHAKKTNERLAAIKSAVQRGEEAFEEAEAMLLRMTLIKNEVCVGASLSRQASEVGRGRSLGSVADNVFDRIMRHG